MRTLAIVLGLAFAVIAIVWPPRAWFDFGNGFNGLVSASGEQT